MRPSFDI